MRFGSLEFAPSRWPTAITALLLAILLSLGFWQLDRAEQKQALLDQYDGDQAATVVQLEPHLKSFDGLQYQAAVATGFFDGEHQFLLDNRTHDTRVGYHVLTPFRLRHSDVAVLVNRGWIPLERDRSYLPNPEIVAGQREIKGRIKLPSSATFMLADETPRAGWPYRIQAVDLPRLEQELGYPLLPIVLLLDNDEQDGFVREWRPLTFGPERNIGYAVQWFGLALTLFIIYVTVNTKKVK